MREFLILFVHLIVTVVRVAGPGGVRSVIAESLILRHQLLIRNRGRKRAPNLRAADRILAGLCTLFILWFAIILCARNWLTQIGMRRNNQDICQPFFCPSSASSDS
jgi:hypothetical protein